jgi:uncharacterized HAD superfamily protein
MERKWKPRQASEPLPDSSKDKFEEFLLAEYNNIAQAHFHTYESLANFIKYYVIVASLPFTIAALFLSSENLKAAELTRLLSDHQWWFPLFMTGLSSIGILLLGYLASTRFDGILYARTVNGIRKYFYDRSPISFSEELQIRALPRNINVPKYNDQKYFSYVVLTFMLVGTTYFGIGWYAFWQQPDQQNWSLFRLIVIVIVFAWLHWLVYQSIANYRERAFLQRPIIGVDVDGVLNSHRQQFCSVLQQTVNKQLLPESIVRIPVHEIEGVGVLESDEHAVFNWPGYWTTMPVMDNRVSGIIRKLQHVFGFRIWIFTHRPWPEPSSFPHGKEPEYWAAWRKTSAWSVVSQSTHGFDRWLESKGIPGLFHRRLIQSITQKWLSEANISYNKLVVEGGNTYTADSRLHFRNRFAMAKKHEFRAFVEDDLAKAKKLANICSVVFLIDQPYNQCEPSSIPRNLVRVKSWREIEVFFRDLA